MLVGRSARKKMGAIALGADIEIHENVPETLPFFARTDVMLYAPPAATGMKVKVTEALALGTVVVTTKDGAEGLDARDGHELGLAEDDDGLIRRTIDLLRSPERRAAQRSAGRSLIERTCGGEKNLDAIEAIYARIVSQGKR
jgi:glycosyltransferase involved in cell wall biosynthesis